MLTGRPFSPHGADLLMDADGGAIHEELGEIGVAGIFELLEELISDAASGPSAEALGGAVLGAELGRYRALSDAISWRQTTLPIARRPSLVGRPRGFGISKSALMAPRRSSESSSIAPLPESTVNAPLLAIQTRIPADNALHSAALVGQRRARGCRRRQPLGSSWAVRFRD
jgi:hypothetical protein